MASNNEAGPKVGETGADMFNERRSDEIERVLTASSVSTAHTGAVRRFNGGMTQVSTQRDLERHPTELSRIHTQRSQQEDTVGRSLSSKSRDDRRPLPNFGAGKPYPPQIPDQEMYVVEFDGEDDPLHAQNWPLPKKLVTAAVLGFTTTTASFASSIFASATRGVGAEFGVSSQVGVLGVSLYVLGFATGPTLWAPFSELRGRRLPLLLAMTGFTLFSLATATAKDLQTVLISRFFGGFFGACPLAVVAAVFSDMFDNKTRGIAITLFSMAAFTGPMIAPLVGAFISESYLGWRWTQYLLAIMGLVALILDLMFLEETYPPQILVSKAAELRRRTLNWGIHAKQEEVELDVRELITRNLSRPMRLLFMEPIVTLLSFYTAFVYGILYLFLTAYPLVFVGVYHFTPGVAGLAFLGMILGQLIAGLVVLAQQPWYQRKLAANNGVSVPEWRLPSVIAGGVAFAIGIFWLGWSGYSGTVHWIVPMLSGVFTGFGLMSIFLQATNYLIDAYLLFAASAIAGNTFLRSLAGAVFPLFSTRMFESMGIHWASTLLGCVAVVLAPIPLVFYLHGHQIRARSHFAPTLRGDDDVDRKLSGSGSGSGSANGMVERHDVRDAAVEGAVPRRTSDAVGNGV